MKYSLRAKLSLSYISITLFLVFLMSLFTNVYMEKHFQDYVIRQQEQKNNEVVNLIRQQYRGGSNWDRAVIENVGINALENGMIVKVRDVGGNLIWDATVHNNGLCTDMLSHMAKNMESRYPNFKGGYVEDRYTVDYNFQQVGLVEIGYYGPFFFSDNDLAFINSINKMLIGIGLLSLVLALVFGAFMAKRLSMPISRVIKAAQMISKGYFGERIAEKSNTMEIGQLTSTFNNLAETLEKQEALRKRMSADVAHELRTPVATLQSHLEAMMDGIWEPDAQRLKSCHEEVLRIGRMVGDLEKLARYEGENLILNKESLDVSELVETILRNFESDFKHKGIELKFFGGEQVIYADRDKISQIAVNLLSNALKYTLEGGKVEVHITGTDQTVEIIVEDNGQGISGEDLPHIFERFYRADKSRNRLTGGSGIGLTITRALVEAHGGKISVKSEMNIGTEFAVSLPKACSEGRFF